MVVSDVDFGAPKKLVMELLTFGFLRSTAAERDSLALRLRAGEEDIAKSAKERRRKRKARDSLIDDRVRGQVETIGSM